MQCNRPLTRCHGGTEVIQSVLGRHLWEGSMLDLAKHIVNQESGSFEPEKFEDHYETALIDLINQKRAGKA